jgi:5'-3' exonuclease
MDCNSILYDVFHSIKEPHEDTEIFYQTILDKTVLKIEEYIQQIQPEEILYIAFDGVAPFAKMEQQRNRRYKSAFQLQITSNSRKISTSIFTPGTKFMHKLSHHINNAFLGKEIKYSVSKIIVATPLEPGEGEHKLYEHLRNFPVKNSKIAIYGLDADLIMLSLFHLNYTENIYVFREAPEFMKSVLCPDKTQDKNELWGMDIAQLGRSISNEMACNFPDNHRMYDYVFLCFFLGNDFLPHFPALNIRTHGIQRLLDVYRECIGNKPNTFLITKTFPLSIHWKELHRFIYQLSKYEHEFIIQEYEVRKKWEYLGKKGEVEIPNFIKDIDLFEETIQNSPVIFRQEEKYISPSDNGWEERYYLRCFDKEYNKKDICVNYLEGLEWVLKYYTNGCADWKWKYHYNYPTLLKDLSPCVPNYKIHFIPKNEHRPVSSNVQLAYVLPKNQLHLLPEVYYTFLLDKYRDLYPENNYKFIWLFCRYLWESHICLPDIPIDKIESEFSHFTPST